MSRSVESAQMKRMAAFGAICLATALGFAPTAHAQSKFAGIGRTATPAEIKAWDIDVRPDFAGLPKGSGSVKQGEDIWDAKCASCHGTFGESNSTFTPLAGGTTQEDIASGHVASLTKPDQQRTTLMKLAQISTLWDYINRAMPWNAPKTLNTDEVYAVTAFILNLGDIVPEDFVLSDANIAEVQKRLPNRNGMTRAHGMWKINGKPDTHNVACMANCAAEAKAVSQLPDYAVDAHGNLAEQNRIIGPVRGTRTVKLAAAAATPAPAAAAPSAHALAEKSGCLACHGVANKVVGPGFNEVAARYKGDGGAPARLAAKVKVGGAGAWGPIPMPPNSGLKDEEVSALVQWVLDGAK